MAPFLGIAAGLLAGWSGFAVTSVAWVAILIWPMDAAHTRAHATGEDPGRSVARLVALIGSVASLGAVTIVLIQTQNTSELESYLLAAIAVVSVAASWALIQADYMLRVAHIYYGDPVGGHRLQPGRGPVLHRLRVLLPRHRHGIPGRRQRRAHE